MAIYKDIYQVLNGVATRINLATAGFQFHSDSFLVGASTPAELTKAILLNLISLQNASEVGGTLHTHNGIYFTETELGAVTGVTGSDLIGDDNTYTNFTPGAATVKAALSAIDTALSGVGTVTFSDSIFRIFDNGDSTKRVAFEVSAIATSTTRTITVPDANVDLGNLTNSNISASAAIALTKLAALTASRALVSDGSGFVSVSATTSAQIGFLSTVTSDIQVQVDSKLAKAGDTMSGVLNMGGNRIASVGSPTNAGDAATKSYVDAVTSGNDFQPDVNDKVANATTTAPGVGLPAATTGQRYILVSGTDSLEAAWGTITGVGNNDIVQYNGASWFVAYDVSVQGAGALVWNRAAAYFEKWDASSWTEYGGLSGVTAGLGLSKSGNTLNINFGAGIVELPSDEVGIDLWAASGLLLSVDGSTPSTAAGAQLSVRLDGATIARSGSGIKVATSGITANELATDSVVTVKIQDLAVTTAKIANASVTDAKAAAGSNLAKVTTKTMLVAEDTAHFHNSLILDTVTAGESFAASSTFFAYMADAAGSARVYKATNDRSAGDKYEAMFCLKMTSTITTSNAIAASDSNFVQIGGIVTMSSAVFATSDVGKVVWLGTAGSFTLTAPDVGATANLAAVRLGNVVSTTTMRFAPQVVAIS